MVDIIIGILAITVILQFFYIRYLSEVIVRKELLTKTVMSELVNFMEKDYEQYENQDVSEDG